MPLPDALIVKPKVARGSLDFADYKSQVGKALSAATADQWDDYLSVNAEHMGGLSKEQGLEIQRMHSRRHRELFPW